MLTALMPYHKGSPLTFFSSSQKYPGALPASHLCALSTVVALSSYSVFSCHRIKSETFILLCCSCSHSILFHSAIITCIEKPNEVVV